MRWRPTRRSRGTTSCRACAAISSRSSAEERKPGWNSTRLRRSPGTRESAIFCSGARRRAPEQSRKRNVIVHLVDGTYELFRHFYGLRSFKKGVDEPHGAVIGVLNTVLQMVETGATHVGVATDHVIESFRNRLWSGYKTGDGMEPALLAQFHPLEDALAAMGVSVWPMTDLEADDALASAARIASQDAGVEKVCIWTPDKD